MNQTLEQYLHIYCNYQQDDSFNLLSVAEFSYNNTQQTSLKSSPFHANYGYNPNFTIDLHANSSNFPDSSVPAANDLADTSRQLHEHLIETLTFSQNQQAQYYDAKHERVEFNIGDKVWLLATNIRTQRPSKKLNWKQLGPYTVKKKVGTQPYQLDLSKPMKIQRCISRFSLRTIQDVRHRKSTLATAAFSYSRFEQRIRNRTGTRFKAVPTIIVLKFLARPTPGNIQAMDSGSQGLSEARLSKFRSRKPR